jgi:hypothetical protein
MPERSALTQGVQVGVETVPGTNVAANKKLVSLGIEPSISIDMARFRPMGQKFVAIVTPGKEWVEADLTGAGSYTELLFPLSSVLVAPGAPTTVDGTARKWDFVPSSVAEDTVKTLTVEQGGVIRAHKFNYGLVTELELGFSRDGVEVSGSMIGQRLSDNIVLTAAPTSLPEAQILPTDLDVYVDPTFGALGTTKQTRVLEASWSIGDRFNPVWVLNSANSSFVAHVESEPSAQMTVMVEADTQGMAYLTNARAGSTRFVRIKGTSPILAGATTEPYSISIDGACKVSEPGDFSDEDGVYAMEWTMDLVHDVAWTKAMAVSVVNRETAL